MYGVRACAASRGSLQSAFLATRLPHAFPIRGSYGCDNLAREG